MDNNKVIVKNTVSLYVRMFITMVISFFSSRITLELLGVTDFGLNNLVGGMVALFSFLSTSMGTAVQRFLSVKIGEKEENGLYNVFGTAVLVHTIIAFVTLLLLEVFAIFFLAKLNIPLERMQTAKIVFQISSISMALNVINVPFAAALRAHEDFSKLAIVEVAQAIVRFALLFTLYFMTFDKLVALSLLNFIVSIGYVSAIYHISIKHQEVSFHISLDKTLLKEMFVFTLMILVGTFSNIFKDKMIVILINLFCGLTINAAYAVGIQVKSLIESFALNFKQSVVPQIMSSYSSGNRDRTKNLVFSSSKFAFYLMLLMVVPFIFESQYLLTIWLKNPPEHSGGFVSLLAINSLIYTFPYFIMQTISASGNIKVLQISAAVVDICSIGVMWLFLEIGYSYYSIIFVLMVVSTLYIIVNMICANTIFNFDVLNFFCKTIIPCILVAIICIVPVYFVHHYIVTNNFVRLLAVVLTEFVSILIACYTVGLDKKEKIFISSMILNYIKR